MANANDEASGMEEFLAGFQRVEKEVRAVQESALAPVNLDVPSVVATVLGAWPEISELRDRVAALQGSDVSRLDNLRDYALALAHAHSAHRGAAGPPDGLSKVAEELSAIRDVLFADATALAKRGVFDEARIAKLRSGPGYKSLAFDVVGLVQVLRERWGDISERTGVQLADLDRAAQLAQRLVTGVALKEQQPASASAASLLRQQAFTVLVEAYDEVRRALSFLRWHEQDLEAIAPSLWAGRGARPVAENAVEAAPASAPGTGTLPGVGIVSPSSASPGPGSAPVVGLGLPGSAPFVRS